jgi:CRISPR type III-A-associated RAMP protein Csm5
MSKVKIETLTSIHIGSGEMLKYGYDFIEGIALDGQNVLGVICPRKMLKLIGEDKIDAWVTAIDNGRTTDEIVKQYAPNAQINDYTSRIIIRWSPIKPTDTLKEFIHDGLGRPYIPGSSIKGAIRTAILASLAAEVNDKERKIDKSFKDRKGYDVIKANASEIEKTIFGQDPNSDVFRFLQVGDAYFGKKYEVAIKTVNINERKVQSFWDESKPLLIEALCDGNISTFNIKLNLGLYNQAKSKVHSLPSCMNSMTNLFTTINSHTRKLVKEEIEYWKERSDNENAEGVEEYIEKCELIADIIAKCEIGKSCVLRVGYGSGWRFITGAWAESLTNFENIVVPASRPANYKYAEYNFPKSRRVDNECELLGFIKLSIVD